MCLNKTTLQFILFPFLFLIKVSSTITHFLLCTAAFLGSEGSLGIEPSASCTLGQHSNTELCPQPSSYRFSNSSPWASNQDDLKSSWPRLCFSFSRCEMYNLGPFSHQTGRLVLFTVLQYENCSTHQLLNSASFNIQSNSFYSFPVHSSYLFSVLNLNTMYVDKDWFSFVSLVTQLTLYFC